MKARLAPIVFAAALVVLAYVLFRGKHEDGREAGWRAATEDKRGAPEDTVFSMVGAAQNGDADVYLDCFWGSVRTRLEQTRKEMGGREFAAYLVRAGREVKGVAVIGQPEPMGAELKLKVEMVYTDKNEVQNFVLTRRRRRWRISSMGDPRRIPTIIPYGTEAFPLTPPAGSETQDTEP
jgi:hypothetical protein